MPVRSASIHPPLQPLTLFDLALYCLRGIASQAAEEGYKYPFELNVEFLHDLAQAIGFELNVVILISGHFNRNASCQNLLAFALALG